ncbi:hypothetical protein FRACYDRAFT_239737 [Fragilariopsis cylindrus CCMP1102]|uniref:Uncharacterized protein n=1 Tax=Fragilariopsis cylindrus CCMP1102 TaxID=635003 RepID=A0A1E7FAL7_9STRA|nr:hypothetical protein FRACYDRAFT_239737 [Fragilariopsis cylindrus CCMP1102]|eukprot:OEU15055.1 hypothetical protein FRACYDRAFT_239737 [Fragilariopsis cylindrus CCMP1102]
MAMRIQWSVELVTKTEIVPRLEDHLIDDLFYQEDEIGEMRHTAFMVECGLEEDPPDGPDVAPVPWGDMLLKIQLEQNQINDDDDGTVLVVNDDIIVTLNDEDCNNSNNSSIRSLQRNHRELPSRSQSTDDLAIELTISPVGGRRIYHPRLAAVPRDHVPRRCKSVSLDMKPSSSLINDLLSHQKSPDAISKQYVGSISSRRPAKSPTNHPPSKAASNDDVHNMGLNLAFAKTERPSPMSPNPTKDRISYRTKRETFDEEKRSPPLNRLLGKTKSGTSHDMGIGVAKARAMIESASKDQDALTNQNSPLPIRRAPVTRSLIAAKSGTLHEMRTNTKTKDAVENSPTKRGAPVVRRSLMAAKSGTLHGMRTSKDLATKKQKEAAAETEDAVDNNNTERNQNSPGKRGAPVVRRSLMAAKSGTLHGMRTSKDLATKKQKEAVAETEDAVDNNNTERNQNSPAKRGAPVRRSLMAAKSGTLHGMQKKISKPEEISNIQREHSNNNNGNLSHSSKSSSNKKEIEHDKKEKISVVYKNGKKTIIRQPHSISDDDFLDDIVSSDNDTNISSDPKDKSSVKKKKKKKKSEDLENKKGNGISVPSSPSQTKKKTLKSLLSETKSNLRSVGIRQQEIDLMQSPDEYLPSSGQSTKSPKIKKKEKLKNSRASDTSDTRPDDCIGSKETKRRTYYKVKTKEKLDL